MSKISTYEVTPVPKLADKLIGTSVGGEIEDITYNFTLSELLNLFIPNIPANTLQGVLDYGNEATQDIILNGTIFTTYLEVTDTATILNSYLTEETHIAGSLYDRLDSAGTAGQVLRSTGTQVEWYSIPNVIPTLQQVLAAGNTADINIILSANIQALTATANNVVSNTSLSVNGTLKDKDASVGTAGQVLSSTGTKVQWIALPVYTATSPLSIDSITRVISIQQASASQNGYLSSADWITFDGKQGSISLTTIGSSGPSTLVGSTINVPNYTLSGLGGVPQTRTLTINGVTYNLSADRTWTIAAGVSSVTATTPLFSTGGVNPDISIQQSSSSLDGYLSNVDWLTFNSKQPAGNYITSLTGEATAAGPGAAAVTLSNAAVIGKLLTGLNITGGTVVSTDSILTAFGKVQNQINGLVGGVIYKGVWNAATNTPTLVSSVGVQGNYYIVNVAGNTNLNGITDWNVGDWAIFNGSTWNKVDNTDAVTSVNGQTGAVSLTTDNIPEGATNLYYLDSRARAALSFAAGSGAYNSTTGVITIPTDNSQILNGAGYITLASLSASSPLSYNNLTGAFSIQVANTTQNGYLSSTDWNTFNGKQPFLGGTGLVKSVAGTISYITDNSANWNTAYNDSIISAAVTGTSTKTLTLTQQDAGTITASWTDLGLTSVGVSMPSAFSVSGSPLTSNGTIAITGAGTTLQYIDGTGALQSFPSLTGYVPYTGATANVNLGIYNLTAASLIKSGGTSSQFLKADGSVDSSAYIVLGSLSATAPLSYNSTTGAFTISQAGTASNGYLSSTDWNTFNDKQPFITAGTTLQYYRGDKTFQTLNTTAVPEGTNLYFTNARAIASTLTGYVSGAGTISATDSLLTAIQKLNGNISGLTTGVSSVFGRTGAVIAVSGDYTTTLVPEGTNLYYLDSRARAAVSLTTVGSSGASTYNSTTGVFNIPNYGSALTGYVPTSRTLNINGTSYDLSADRSWSVGTVTSVAALTIGTTGTDLSSSVATGTTTPVITLNVPTASAANRGALSSADWSTFNTKVGGVTATTPLFSSGGSTPNLTIQQSSGSQAGYLSSTDWTTFNNKQAAGNYITSLTGEATATGPGAAAVTLDNAAVTGKVLTGVNITGGTILATDTMLTGFGKLQNQVNGLIGGSIYQGTWNAATNTPTLTSGVGVQGYYYIVSVAGTTNLDGITDWFVGDWAIFNGGVWQQVDNTDAVVSVNGQTGAVSLTTDNIPEGTTNLYYTNTRARAALSFVAGSGAYNSSTGVITIPTNTSQLTNGANFITLASLSGTAPISYNSGTGAISITQAATASNGYLSSTDWNTFNNKQSALTNPVLASGSWTSNYIPKINGTYTLTNSLLYDGGSSIGVNTNAPHDSTQFKLDVNGGLLIKNTSGTTAQLILINSDPAAGGNNGFVQFIAGGNTSTAFAELQTYYGLAIASGALRLQPTAGQVLVGTTTASAFKVDINGTLRATGQLTLGSTITNGTYTYTLPGATGTLALVGGSGVGTVTSVAALTLGTTGTDLSSTVANSTTTPVITLNVPTASATNRGALSSADWTTFNNKQATISLTTTGTSGAATLVGATLNIPNYTTDLSGYVPYTGATGNVNLGIRTITAAGGFITTTGGSDSVIIYSDGTYAGGIGLNYGTNPNHMVLYYNGATALKINTSLAATFGGTVTSTALTVATSLIGVGRVVLNSGDATHSGYINWYNGSISRLGYMGYNNTDIELTLEGTSTFKVTGGAASFSNNVSVGTSLTAQSALFAQDVVGDPVYMRVRNLNTGGYSSAMALSLYGYSGTAAYYDVLTIRASYPGYGKVDFFVKGQSTSTSISALSIDATNGAAIFSDGITISGGSNGYIINQNGGAAGLATYSANSDRAQIAFKYAQNYPASNNYTRVLDIVSTGDGTGGGIIRLFTTINNSVPSVALILASTGAATFNNTITTANSSGTSVNITTNGNNGTSASPLQTNVNFYGYNGNLNGQIRVDDIAGTAQIGTMKFYTWNSAQVLALTLAHTGAATFTSSVTGTIFDSTSNAFRFNGSNALSLVTLSSQNVVKINAAGYWGVQLVGASDQGLLINNVGSVGIGTVSPQLKLDIQNGNVGFYNPTASSNGAQLYLGDMNFAGGAYATSAPGIGAAYNSSQAVAGDLALYVYASTASSRNEAMRIKGGTGNVGIGQTNATVLLDLKRAHAAAYGSFVTLINLNGFFPGYDVDAERAGISAGVPNMGNTTYGWIGFNTRGADGYNNRMVINGNGNVMIGTTTDYSYKLYVVGSIYASGDVIAYSDISVKKNIRSIENVLERVTKSRGVLYDRKDIDSNNNIGFIAQELELQFPELISVNIDGTKGVKYQNAVAVLFEAIKEQQKQIDELKIKN